MDAKREAREKRLYELVVRYAGDNPGYRMAGWLLDHGKFFMPAPLPVGIERGDIGKCDVNTLFVVSESLGQYRYVEGFGFAEDKAIIHIWAATTDGIVIDSTWDVPESRAYFGFAIDDETLAACAKRNRMFSVLEWYVKELAEADHA